jgi:enoyl-[acyl-carrier-protein] reductase (NADH)
VETNLHGAFTMEKVAAGITFLLSDDATAITGQLLCIDGGTTA